MLKQELTESDVVTRGIIALKDLLAQVPAVTIEKVTEQPVASGARHDFTADVTIFGKPHILVVEAKSNGQPRFVRNAILQLRDYIAKIGGMATPLLLAPYLSPETRALCREEKISFLDLEGNARIAFDNMFIEHVVPTRPLADRRGLKSLFKPKSAQILRVLLRNPWHSWKVKDLAEVAGVSTGQVSNIRTALLDREWATKTFEGFTLLEPNLLLDTWRDNYEAPAGERLNYYTTKHGLTLENVSYLSTLGVEEKHVALAAFSAANWFAPYGRVPTQYFYADRTGHAQLKDRLNLSTVEKGENIVITVLKDRGPLRDTIEAAPGINCTGIVQTYLDLWQLGERGREAAEHLRQEKLLWPK